MYTYRCLCILIVVYVYLSLSMYSYCCLCTLIVVYALLLLSMYSYCCLCILIVRPCILIVGKVNMDHQLDATITVLLISKISSTCFGQRVRMEAVSASFILTRSAKQHAQKPCLPHQKDIIPYAVKICLALLKMGKSLPETC
jgi:hypothetical protein